MIGGTIGAFIGAISGGILGYEVFTPHFTLDEIILKIKEERKIFASKKIKYNEADLFLCIEVKNTKE